MNKQNILLMSRFFLFIGSLLICNSLIAQHNSNIIPSPSEINFTEGDFSINSKTNITVKDKSLLPVAKYLSDYIFRLSGHNLKVINNGSTQTNIVLELNDKLGKDSYSIKIDQNTVLSGNNYRAVAQAAASLIQLIQISDNECTLPFCSIIDQPNYEFSAVMLDVARFWHPLETLYETVDMLWFYKIKYLQLHLSDNNKVTFPLEEYPLLKITNNNGEREYYTKSELESLVQYAKDKGVSIIPEIEVPGHSSEFWKLYPEVFGSTGDEKSPLYVVNMANEKTYTALNLIIKELAEVFYTSPFIHIGGDEVYLENLKKIKDYKEFAIEKGLTTAAEGDANELFCYFINRLNGMVKATGKKTLVWEGFHKTGAGKITVDKDITVMVWNTTYNTPQNLQSNGYKIINATWMPWYMVGAMNFAPSTQRAYDWNIGRWDHWNPEIAPIQLHSHDNIVGSQITFWEQSHEQVIPVLRDRIGVLSEKLWSKHTIPFDDFLRVTQLTDKRYQALFQPVQQLMKESNFSKDLNFTKKAFVSLSSQNKGKIKYVFSKSWDFIDWSKSKEYSATIPVTESGVLSAQLFDENDNAIGYKTEQYYTKIEPIYKYQVFGNAPIKGWGEMPTTDTLTLLKSGYTGRMNEERIGQINRKLFAKVKTEGHIDTRLNGLWNPYLIKLSGGLNIPMDDTYTLKLQTWDGLADIYIDDKLIAKGKDFKNAPETFEIKLTSGKHNISIQYFYRNIQNQLSINYKTASMINFEPLENLIEKLEVKE